MPLTRLAQELGVPAQDPLVVERHDRSFIARYYVGGTRRLPSLRITTRVDETNDASSASAFRGTGRAQVHTRPAIILRRETGWDRLGKKLGLNREVQTGDPELDALVYIETNSAEEDVQRTLADDRLRRAVRDLMAMRVYEIRLDPAGLSVRLTGTSDTRLGAADFEGITERLGEVASALPLFQAGQAKRPRSRLTELLVLVVAAIAMLLMATAAGSPPIDVNAREVGLGGGLGLWVAVTMGLAIVVRGRSDSLRRVVVLSLAALLVLPVGLYSSLCRANRALDSSPPVDHLTKVTRMWTQRGKNSTSFNVEVASWRPGEATLSLDVPRALYSTVGTGSKMVVTTHAGKLGWEWLDGFRVAP